MIFRCILRANIIHRLSFGRPGSLYASSFIVSCDIVFIVCTSSGETLYEAFSFTDNI